MSPKTAKKTRNDYFFFFLKKKKFIECVFVISGTLAQLVI